VIEERERATTKAVAMAASLVMTELAPARAKVEAAAAATELEALRVSSIGISVSADDDRDNELKLAREAAWEQAAQWAAVHPQGCRGGSSDERGCTGGAPGGGAHGGCAPDGGSSPDRRERMTAGLTEIVAFTGGAALPPQIYTMVTIGSRPLSGTSVPAAGGLPSPRPTTLSGSR
jgi:hypothetical protein